MGRFSVRSRGRPKAGAMPGADRRHRQNLVSRLHQRVDRPGRDAALQRAADRRSPENGNNIHGQQQKLTLAGALARKVKRLLLEPCGGLAPVTMQQTEMILEPIKTLGVSAIIAERNAAAALHRSDRAIIFGTAGQVLETAGLRQEYLAI